MKNKQHLHCGACGALFETVKALVAHLRHCPAAHLGTALITRAIKTGLEPNATAPNSERKESK